MTPVNHGHLSHEIRPDYDAPSCVLFDDGHVLPMKTKAVFLDQTGGPEMLVARDHDLQPPGSGQILVRHDAIGVNFIDIYKRKGLYPVDLPAILGSEAAGAVEAVGDGVKGFSPGDRVAYIADGAYAEAANVPASAAVKIPHSIDPADAAALFLKGLTVEMLVRQVFPLRAEHTCLVYAASGGVGTLLCQWANHIGARVIAVVGNENKAALAKENGANDVIIRTQTDSISNTVRGLTNGRGVDVVYDSVGEATFEASLNSLAMRGHMVTYGNASGPPPPVHPLELARLGSLTLTRPTLFHYATPDRLPAMAEELFAMVAKGVLKTHVAETFPLEKAGEAQRRLESGATTGAIVITP